MNDHPAPRTVRTAGRMPLLCQLALLLVVSGSLPDVHAQGLQPVRSASTETSQSQTRAATVVRVISSRSHMQCPLPGKNSRVLSIDSPREWEDTIEHQDEVTALGRKVRWSRERVLVYALDNKAHAGVRLVTPSKSIRLSHGILYWPVRQILPEQGAMKAMVPTRPCVMTTIDRAYWQRIKVVPAPA